MNDQTKCVKKRKSLAYSFVILLSQIKETKNNKTKIMYLQMCNTEVIQ